MKDISYHILDIVLNSLNAGSTSVIIELTEYSGDGMLQLKITDNGRGMSEQYLNTATDPFFTSSVTKKVGLGLPLLKQNAEQTGGYLTMLSGINKGTTVTAMFNTRHIDMLPIGDPAMTFRSLLASNPRLDMIVRIAKDGEGFGLDTRTVREELGDIMINSKEVLDYLCEQMRNYLKTLSVFSY